MINLRAINGEPYLAHLYTNKSSRHLIISVLTIDCVFISLQKFKRTMRAIQGALIVASTLQIVLGFSGLWRNVARLVHRSQ